MREGIKNGLSEEQLIYDMPKNNLILDDLEKVAILLQSKIKDLETETTSYE